MIRITNTENVTGVNISGDYDDLNLLVHAFHAVTINEYAEKHVKNLSKIARRIAEFQYDPLHNEIKEVVTKAAREYECSEEAIRLEDSDYPDEIVW